MSIRSIGVQVWIDPRKLGCTITLTEFSARLVAAPSRGGFGVDQQIFSFLVVGAVPLFADFLKLT